ncbi:uncharacterized protein N7459_005287 [Penicillium hispanicum]|uniref:uncharacterized protein n=1 Tax=Penicillium hispanicum TaxID=1080232 RepID=UPI0025414E55|nr:uncharacterized protein N7459_005287 [Penicillium hispanicum]KAJ5585487.1 hypothetical protein N7459_005287 [Penicillium hispanicum]
MAYISGSDGSRQPAFLTAMPLLLLLSCLSVGFRIYCRVYVVHKIGLDDYLILSGLVVTIAMGIMNGFHVSFGTGRHMADLPLEKILIPTLKHWYVYQLVYPLAIGLVKFSILTQYYRIFAVDRFRIGVIAVGIFVFIYTITVIFVNAFECHSKPWRAWSPSFPEGCNNLGAVYFSTAGINIATDLVILVMPIPLLMHLNLHHALVAIFLTGTFASAASIARLNALYIYNNTKDVPYDAIRIEVNVAIISASAPSLRPLFASVFKSSSYDNYRSPSNNPYGGYERYGTGRSNRQRSLRPSTTGAIELSSRDEEQHGNSVDISSSRAPNGPNESQDRILEPNANITKTVVIEMKSEQRQ